MIRLLSPVDMLGVPESYLMEGILSGTMGTPFNKNRKMVNAFRFSWIFVIRVKSKSMFWFIFEKNEKRVKMKNLFFVCFSAFCKET